MANSRNLTSIDAIEERLSAAVTQCLRRHALPTQRLVVGFSGGVDSVCLLHVLATRVIPDVFPADLSALHVHHGLSAHADAWERFCLSHCESMNIPCETIRVRVERGARDGLEGAARRVRHAVYASCAADWILLAHQRDDQAETLLFNLARGCGIAGAAAMRERNGRLLRPLLSIARCEIEHYARSHGLSWCEDDSNVDTRYSRNYLRHRVLPALGERFPAAALNLGRAAARFADALDLLNDLARIDLAGNTQYFPVSVALLTELGESRALNVLRYLLSHSQAQIPGEARLREALRQMLAAAPDRHPCVALGRHRLTRRRGAIYLDVLEG